MSSKKVFVLDDEYVVRRVVCRALEKRGFSVTGFERAERLFETLESENCGLIITDMKMPGSCGLELVNKIRQKHREIPVVVISGSVSHEVEELKDKLGVCEVLLKPFEIKRLQEVADRWCC